MKGQIRNMEESKSRFSCRAFRLSGIHRTWFSMI
jgi:hypothetical protein